MSNRGGPPRSLRMRTFVEQRIVWPILDFRDWILRRDLKKPIYEEHHTPLRKRARWAALDTVVKLRAPVTRRHPRWRLVGLRALQFAALPLVLVGAIAFASAGNDEPTSADTRAASVEPPPPTNQVAGVQDDSEARRGRRAERRKRIAAKRRAVARRRAISRKRAARRRAVARRRAARRRARARADDNARSSPAPALEERAPARDNDEPSAPSQDSGPPPSSNSPAPAPSAPSPSPAPPRPPSGGGGGGNSGGGGGGGSNQPAPGVEFDDSG